MVATIYPVLVLRVPSDDNYLSCCSSAGCLLVAAIYPVVVLQDGEGDYLSCFWGYLHVMNFL